MEEKHNPNYHERLRSKSWSVLPQDLLISVFERLSFANFERAKSVCSSWYSASRQSVPNNQIPWLILFPDDNDNNKNNSCTMFNPEEKHKLYKTKDLGVKFAKSTCLATYGSWLLMRDPQVYPMYDIYIVNLFTHERINLPPLDLLWKDYELYIASDRRKKIIGNILYPVFWIEEKTKDYIVVWGFKYWCVVYSKKGDTSWNQIPQTSDCFDMVYKDHMLYFLSYMTFYGHLKIFDFSGEIPLQTFRGTVRVEEVRFDRGVHRQPCAQQLVVTLTGIVLKVDRWRRKDKTWYFKIFKVYPSESMEKPEQIHSLGDESILLDQGITVLANDTDGFIRNSIYFTLGYGPNKDTLIFNLETQETMEPPLHTLFDSSSFQFSEGQWFLPSFTHT